VWANVRRFVACLLASALLFLGNGLRAASEPELEDDFLGDTLDVGRWLIERRAGNDQGTPRAELQYYSPDAVRVSNGNLHIVVSRATTHDPRTGATLRYTAGRIQTRRTFLYGRFEFRARLPKGRGLWPALWLRTPPDLPLNGEIDVLEGYGSHPNLIQSTLHPWANGREARQYCAWLLVRPNPDSPRFHRSDCERVEDKIHLSDDLSAGFHVYAIDWSPKRVTWFLDGVPYFSISEEIPHEPMVIVLELAVSGHWDGDPAGTTLPQSLDVAYVRVTPSAENERGLR
jgi:beta-glucanase (GH16 family)